MEQEHSLRRVFDVTAAIVFMVLASPVLIAICIAILIEDGRPLFFSHRRLGLHGKPFLMRKFRKFRKDCSADGLQLTLKDDSRFTRVGRFLAATKLDELPQFWNILAGEMSIVGPRPESTHYADCFTNEFSRILDHKPGLLGPSQIKFRHENELYPAEANVDQFYRLKLFPEKAAIDLDYYSRRTLVTGSVPV